MDFMIGADTSCLEAMEDRGARYYDIDGVEGDALKILSLHGVNFIRLRLFNDPIKSFDGGDYCNLEHTLKMAKRIRKYKMGFMLDFHYSDFWADWKAQAIPRKWADQSVQEIENSVYEYTKMAIMRLKEQGTAPDIVQIGNEIGKGLLWEYGSIEHADNIVKFLNAGLKAVEEINEDKNQIKTMIHIECGADKERTEAFFSKLYENGLMGFDYVGLSYYPYWAGEYQKLEANIQNIKSRFNKQIVIVETAFPFTDESHDDMENIVTGKLTCETMGLEPSVENQRNVIHNIIENIKNTENGAGVFYWEPVWYQKSGVGVEKGKGNEWENQAMFDNTGHALESIRAFEF